MKHTSVIIPAAGDGSRLGLDYPKELYEIYPGRRLIDLSMELIPREVAAVNVIIRPEKGDLADYLRKKYPDLPLRFVHFDETYREWPGSVYSANPFFTERNVVLLPDSYLLPKQELSRPQSGVWLFERFISLLKSHAAVFAVKGEKGQRLESMGALFLNDRGAITRFADKPRTGLEQFNGLWTSYAFNRDMGKMVYEALISSVEKTVSSPVLPFAAGGFNISDYFDLGTWPAIEAFKKNI